MNALSSPLARIAITAAFLLLGTPLEATEPHPAGLPPEAPREGTVITVDVSTNTAYLFRDGSLVRSSPVATGMDKVLKKGTRTWLFRTPRGRHTVLGKITNPIWRKPDWAFVEEGKAIPSPSSPSRQVRGKLGKYALDLGDGILIHGTDDRKSFGRKASHGCIRMPDKMLAEVWKEAGIGTSVYVFDSNPHTSAAWRGPESEEIPALR